MAGIPPTPRRRCFPDSHALSEVVCTSTLYIYLLAVCPSPGRARPLSPGPLLTTQPQARAKVGGKMSQKTPPPAPPPNPNLQKCVFFFFPDPAPPTHTPTVGAHRLGGVGGQTGGTLFFKSVSEAQGSVSVWNLNWTLGLCVLGGAEAGVQWAQTQGSRLISVMSLLFFAGLMSLFFF